MTKVSMIIAPAMRQAPGCFESWLNARLQRIGSLSWDYTAPGSCVGGTV